MLKTRIITAIVLLAVLLPVLFIGSSSAVLALCAVFFAAACWESLRLFGHRLVIPAALIWTALFIWLAVGGVQLQFMLVWALGVLAWLIQFLPSLKFGLPASDSGSGRIYSTMYLISILGCFLAILTFQRHSAGYLLSVMALVWIADVGAYFFGRAFGRHKLASSISPGKSWEGALGGWFCVLITAVISTRFALMADSFAVVLQQRLGWSGMALVLSLLTAASVSGDLIESQLKRRAQMKDSSHLLPGHGGVLDRIDALIPVLPLAVLIQTLIEISGKS